MCIFRPTVKLLILAGFYHKKVVHAMFMEIELCLTGEDLRPVK